ncbi:MULTISPECIES: threonine aldolase family protein [Corynebacterium]|uniref:Amino acid lyase n=3 Tax=Corynebacterium flavescens TaxID=28028 RepID=A0A1L7CK54_CORFL|nr:MULTISPECIES: beta-eliminating lyase-related protein [Corynebacterium]APT86189.1 threonine aldolase [Corynebacterium flavescens]KAA8724456.1 threonine aldolase [Corynebacterium flavescens]MDN6099360.1 beta-eliminating lyase-related protein [Corynebacterium flavescens]MDN6198697.1 beta-eliminating lyase-related protein [Corynebacterium flavescens]MDN6227567.1 beta-eliminating lyase-related protein [Corynebacterium flavescens]
MIHFGNDYHRTGHPAVLSALVKAQDSYPGYGEDPLCEKARAEIRNACAAPEAGVHFLMGGTQVNTTAIAATLRPWQGVISADSGHINTHETGSVEHSGHKILALPGHLGKITAAQVTQCVEEYRSSGTMEHAVEPAMVYISQPSEYGTVYSLAELRELREVCDRFSLTLLVDGARLGYGLAAGDATLPDLARLCDIFTIGGTKCGALFGEAIVFPHGGDAYFRNAMKQNSALLAKGWLLGAQFSALFHDNLYEEITAHANEQAQRIAHAFAAAGIDMLFDSPTNQQFALLTQEQEDELSQNYVCQFFEPHGDLRAVRFCTSWSTNDEDIDALVGDIANLAR